MIHRSDKNQNCKVFKKYKTLAQTPGVQLSDSKYFQTFLQLTNAATTSGAFFIYCGITFIGMIYFFICLPETRGISLEHTEELFSSHITFVGLKTGLKKKEILDNEVE